MCKMFCPSFFSKWTSRTCLKSTVYPLVALYSSSSTARFFSSSSMAPEVASSVSPKKHSLGGLATKTPESKMNSGLKVSFLTIATMSADAPPVCFPPRPNPSKRIDIQPRDVVANKIAMQARGPSVVIKENSLFIKNPPFSFLPNDLHIKSHLAIDSFQFFFCKCLGLCCQFLIGILNRVRDGLACPLDRDVAYFVL